MEAIPINAKNERNDQIIRSGMLGLVALNATPGRAVLRGFGAKDPHEVPGAVLSFETRQKLQVALRATDRAQFYVESDL